MISDQDAFGKHLMAQYSALINGEPIAAEIVERDDNRIDFGSQSEMYFSKYEEWSETERKVIDSARGRILDIGCGAGRHSLYLQDSGFDVTGIDNSPGAVEVCKLRGLKNVLVRSIEETDKFEPDSFDTILMFGNNFGLFGSREKSKTTLDKMLRITTPTARILVQTLNPYLTTDETHLNYHKRNKRLGRMVGQIRLRVRYGMLIGKWFDYLFVSPGEMEVILKNTGWYVEEFVKSEEANYFARIKKTATN